MLARGEGGAFGFISGAEGTGVQSCWRSRCKSLQLPCPRQRHSAVAAQSPRLCAREARVLRGPGVSLVGLAQHCRRGRRAGLTFQFFCMRLSESFILKDNRVCSVRVLRVYGNQFSLAPVVRGWALHGNYKVSSLNSVGYMILEFLRPIQAYNSTREQSRLKGTMAGYPPRPALASARTLHCAQSPLPPQTAAAVTEGGVEGTREFRGYKSTHGACGRGGRALRAGPRAGAAAWTAVRGFLTRLKTEPPQGPAVPLRALTRRK